MIRISAKAEYAGRAMLQLSMHWDDKTPVQLDTISKQQKIPREFLVQVMSVLTKSGFVSSRRGACGGYLLKKEPREITLKNIIEAIDGKLSEFRCGDHSFSQCKHDPNCVFHSVWEKIITLAEEKLGEVNFAQLAENAKQAGFIHPPCADAQVTGSSQANCL